MKQQYKIPGMVYLPLLIFLGISFYQTASGFSALVGVPFAWAFSGGVTMILFYLTYAIGNKRINGQPILGLLIFFTVCSLFSYAGNFNAVYTQYQTEKLYRDELTKHRQHLKEVLAESDKALDNFSPKNNQKELKIEQLTQQLVRQITDPERPGLGERAQGLVKQIEEVLGEELTEFAGTPKQLAKKYQNNIEDIAKRKFSAGDLGRVAQIKKNNHDYAEQLEKLIRQALSSSQHVKSIGYDVIMKVSDGINTIGSKTQKFINDPEKFSFQKAQFSNQEIGKIAFSFRSGFSQHPYIAILLSVMCLFLDWAVVLYLIVRYGKGHVEPYEPNPQHSDL